MNKMKLKILFSVLPAIFWVGFVQAEELTGVLATPTSFYDLKTKKITQKNDYPGLNRVSSYDSILKYKNYLFFSGAQLATTTQNYQYGLSFMYDINTQQLQKLPYSVYWYFPNKNWIVTNYGIYDLTTESTKNVLQKNDFTQKSDFFGGYGSVSYSYTGPYFYYINKDDMLTERNAETLKDEPLFDFKESAFKEKLGKIDLGPRSPNGRYIAFKYDRGLYYIDLETKKIESAYQRSFADLFNRGLRDNELFWDKDSKYILFTADLVWFNFHYGRWDFYAYNIETRQMTKVNEVSWDYAFWYSWE